MATLPQKDPMVCTIWSFAKLQMIRSNDECWSVTQRNAAGAPKCFPMILTAYKAFNRSSSDFRLSYFYFFGERTDGGCKGKEGWKRVEEGVGQVLRKPNHDQDTD